MDLKINEEFKSLIPELTAEEYEGLEASIIQDGCRDRIVIWKGYIIDGHNRYEICNKHSIAFNVLEKDNLETESDVKLWMINNQFNRRNLPIETRMKLAYRFKEIEVEKAKERRIASLKQFAEAFPDMADPETDLEVERFAKTLPVSKPVYTRQTDDEKIDNVVKGRALDAVAKRAGVSHMTAFQYDAIQRKGTDEQKAQVDAGESSIKKVYTQIQRAERLEQNQATEWPKGKYRVIYADPPWKYDDERSGMGGAIDQYDLMDLESIKALPVKDLAENDAVLFMWATAPLMREAWEVLDAWGFKYKSQLIWNKCKGPVGNYISVRHEHLILATKGSCTPDTKDRPNSVQTIERTGRHSEKPEEFRKIIEQLYTYGNKVELFARTAPEGWVSYGNEIYKTKKSKPEEPAENEPTKEVA